MYLGVIWNIFPAILDVRRMPLLDAHWFTSFPGFSYLRASTGGSVRHKYLCRTRGAVNDPTGTVRQQPTAKNSISHIAL